MTFNLGEHFRIARATAYSAVLILFALLSISTAHYIGYISNLPPQIAILGGLSLAVGVTATFLFYLVACAVLARIVVPLFVSQFLLMDLVLDSLKRGLLQFLRMLQSRKRSEFSNKREAVRIYRKALSSHSWRLMPFQLIIFLVLLFYSYLRPPFERPNATIIAAMVLALLATLARAEIFLISPQRYVSRLREAGHGNFRLRVAREALVGLTGLLVLVSYVSGNARLQYVLRLPPVHVATERYIGEAQVLINIGDLYLLREKVPDKVSFIVLTAHSSITIASDAGDDTILMPIK